jgi:hypothetical protein
VSLLLFTLFIKYFRNHFNVYVTGGSKENLVRNLSAVTDVRASAAPCKSTIVPQVHRKKSASRVTGVLFSADGNSDDDNPVSTFGVTSTRPGIYFIINILIILKT